MGFAIFGAVLVEVGHLERLRCFAVRHVLQGAVVGPGRAEK